MTIYDQNDPDVRLVSFDEKKYDWALRAAYLGWLNDPVVMRLIASPALLKPKGPDFIDESFQRFTRPDCKGFFIWFEPDEAFIGTAKLDSISEHNRSAWDGIMIGNKRYHGRGLAAKVYRVLLAYAFEKLGLNRVSGGCNEKNIPMIRTFERIGYTSEGRLRQADCIDGIFYDHLYYGILNFEFINKHRIILSNE